MIIVKLIRDLMSQQDLTIGGLARLTGLAYTVIEDVVLRDAIPTPVDADIMLRALGVKLEDVLKLY